MQTAELFPATAPVETLGDADISAAIRQFFLTKKGVASSSIVVNTREGIVELTGFTDSLLAQQRAEEIALAVRGVRGVINELVIGTDDVPDAQLRLDVERALANDAATEDYNVRCTAADGVITLTGTVQSWAEKQLVLRVVQGVRGVQALETELLHVRGGELINSDEEMTQQIRELLEWDIRVNPALVEVRTNDRVVHVSGTVGSAAEKNRIVATAYQTGAVRVDARDLFVARWVLGKELPYNPGAPRTDQEVEQAVRDALRYDPRVEKFGFLVQVHDGAVTLAGTVSNLRARQAATQDAHHVVGVWEVHNLLKVRPERTRPDLEIRQAVLDALARQPYLAGLEFSVNVLSGKAYLYGRVRNHFELHQAEDAAAGIAGVVAIENLLTTGPGPAASAADCDQPSPEEAAPASGFADHRLAERIRSRYYWSASLHDQDVEVQVEQGRVTLTGTVATKLAREIAASEAYELGARDVNNHLLVAQQPSFAL